MCRNRALGTGQRVVGSASNNWTGGRGAAAPRDAWLAERPALQFKFKRRQARARQGRPEATGAVPNEAAHARCVGQPELATAHGQSLPTVQDRRAHPLPCCMRRIHDHAERLLHLITDWLGIEFGADRGGTLTEQTRSLADVSGMVPRSQRAIYGPELMGGRRQSRCCERQGPPKQSNPGIGQRVARRDTAAGVQAHVNAGTRSANAAETRS